MSDPERLFDILTETDLSAAAPQSEAGRQREVARRDAANRITVALEGRAELAEIEAIDPAQRAQANQAISADLLDAHVEYLQLNRDGQTPPPMV